MVQNSHFWLALDLREFKEGLFSNSRPHSEWKPPFYVYCINEFKAFVSKHPNLDLSTLTVKRIYEYLMEDNKVIPNIVTKHPTLDFDSNL